MPKLPALPKDMQILNLHEWRHGIRQSVAQRASFRCEHCHKFLGMHGDVDHRIARRELQAKGLSPWDPNNLQYLCTSCHSVKTNKEKWDWAGRREGPKPIKRSKVAGRNLMLAMAGVLPEGVKRGMPP